MMKIELLTFRGCPNAEATQRLLQDVLYDLGIREKVALVEVENDNGEDIEPVRRADSPALFVSDLPRRTGTHGGRTPRQLIEAALRLSP